MDKSVSPPRELVQKWRIDQYGPPYEGGWMNWPAGLIDRMSKLAAVHGAMKTYRKHDKKVSEINKHYGSDAAKTIVELLKVLHGD